MTRESRLLSGIILITAIQYGGYFCRQELGVSSWRNLLVGKKTGPVRCATTSENDLA